MMERKRFCVCVKIAAVPRMNSLACDSCGRTRKSRNHAWPQEVTNELRIRKTSRVSGASGGHCEGEQRGHFENIASWKRKEGIQAYDVEKDFDHEESTTAGGCQLQREECVKKC